MFKTLWGVLTAVSSAFTIYKQVQNIKEAASEAEKYGLIDTSGFSNPLQSLQNQLVVSKQTDTQLAQIKSNT